MDIDTKNAFYPIENPYLSSYLCLKCSFDGYAILWCLLTKWILSRWIVGEMGGSGSRLRFSILSFSIRRNFSFASLKRSLGALKKTIYIYWKKKFPYIIPLFRLEKATSACIGEVFYWLSLYWFHSNTYSCQQHRNWILLY